MYLNSQITQYMQAPVYTFGGNLSEEARAELTAMRAYS